jgi:hypothetical protein
MVLAVGGVTWGVYSVFAGQVLVGVVVFAWSAYVGPSWWRALRRPAGGPEVLRMDAAGVTVRHVGRGEAVAWSVGWPQVRSFTVSEVGVPDHFREHLGPATKILTIEVLDHREVEGPSEHRERLLGWALLTGSTTTRTRLQLLLARVDADAVRRVAAWLAEHQPTVGLDIDVTGPGESPRKRVSSRVAVLVSRRALRTELVTRLREMGLRPEEVAADDVDALTGRLRTCTLVAAVDADAVPLSDAAARAGLDRVVLAGTTVADPTLLVRSGSAWTVLDLTQEEARAQPARPLDDEGIADAMVGLLKNRKSVRQVWRIGPDGVPVAAT